MAQAQSLPAHPALEHLRKLAKRRLKEMRAANPRAQLAQAQLALARDYGFASWRKLKAHVESLRSLKASDSASRQFQDLLAAIKAGDVAAVTRLVRRAPVV